MKNLMKKPAAARKKKRSACMKMHKVMKKVGRQKIIKRPSMHKRAWRENVWEKADSNEIARWKVQKKTENVQARARQAARSGLPYQTKLPALADVAAHAYAAAVSSVAVPDLHECATFSP